MSLLSGLYEYYVCAGGEQFIADYDDEKLILAYSWYRSPAKIYTRKSGKLILLHRLILGAKPGEVVDHINGDVADNRRCNLRVCTQAQNLRNVKKHEDNRSGYKGVSRHFDGRWRARIMMAGKMHHLGLFDSPLDAAKAYAKASRELHGEFARESELAA